MKLLNCFREIYNGIYVFILQSYKSVSVLNSRWIPLNKVQKKLCLTNEDNINDILLNSVKSQINFHQNSTCTLSDGLYFGYLKMQSSVEQIQVFVPRKTPNVLPYYKIRDNSHISAYVFLLIFPLFFLSSNNTFELMLCLMLIINSIFFFIF